MRISNLLMIFCYQFAFTFSHAMEIEQNVMPQVYFTPQDRREVRKQLFSLLDNAQQAVYVAMYWITDDGILDKLIEIKRKNIIVEIFYDESSDKCLVNMEKLLRNDIYPIIFPSSAEIGYMHNKFVMIDFKTIFTGSANFTQTALNEGSSVFNLENIIVLNSNDIATKYLREIIDIEKATFNYYIQIVAYNSDEDIAPWLYKLGPILFKKKSRLPMILYSSMSQFNAIERKRLLDFFRKDER